MFQGNNSSDAKGVHGNVVQTVFSKDQRANSDEIDLLDLYCILLKHKALAITCFVMCLIVGITAIVSTTPLYKSQAVISIGALGKDNPIQNRELLIREMTEELQVSKGNKVVPRIDKIQSQARDARNVFVVTAVASTAKGAQELLIEKLSPIINQHAALYTSMIKNWQEQEGLIKQQLTSIDKGLEILDQKASLNRLQAMEKQNYLFMRSNTIQLYAKLKSENSATHVYPTAYLAEPKTASDPYKPKVALSMVISVIAGLVLAVFAVFVREFFTHMAERLKQRKAASLA